ncbi:MAG: methionyl-tRNA formyltransferase [Gammaproteobacteria bacterium]|nr:MAG: methionyl-tRNA formyltransferase [Gammaproteobacteria bacterium]
MTNNYVVATIKDWQINQYQQICTTLAGNWSLITNQAQLTLANLRIIKPKYIFFPHWSWIVPSEILNEFTCICFHMTDVPYGRGGSPLQNLIARDHKETKLSALKMTNELDAGPVYLKVPLSLNGSAQEIFERSAMLTFEMIISIVKLEPEAIAQTGEITNFERRTPEQSKIQGDEVISKLYDLIRMLDAKSYPKAFLHYGNYTLTFENAALSADSLTAKVTFNKQN